MLGIRCCNGYSEAGFGRPVRGTIAATGRRSSRRLLSPRAKTAFDLAESGLDRRRGGDGYSAQLSRKRLDQRREALLTRSGSSDHVHPCARFRPPRQARTLPAKHLARTANGASGSRRTGRRCAPYQQVLFERIRHAPAHRAPGGRQPDDGPAPERRRSAPRAASKHRASTSYYCGVSPIGSTWLKASVAASRC